MNQDNEKHYKLDAERSTVYTNTNPFSMTRSIRRVWLSGVTILISDNQDAGCLSMSTTLKHCCHVFFTDRHSCLSNIDAEEPAILRPHDGTDHFLNHFNCSQLIPRKRRPIFGINRRSRIQVCPLLKEVSLFRPLCERLKTSSRNQRGD